jgi:hypothetical protein
MGLWHMGVVALPTKILLSMSCHVDAGNILRALGILSMALSTGFPGLRFLWGIFSRELVMLFGCLVTDRTLQVCVARQSDDPLNLGVTRLASRWHSRWFWIVRLMASDTGLNGVMGVGDDLRETARPGRLVLVTEETMRSALRNNGLILFGVLDMGSCGTMTRLARYPLMIASLFRSDFLLVAIATGARAGIPGYLLGVLYDRRGAVVADEAEVRRHKNDTGDKRSAEYDHAGNQKVTDLLGDLAPKSDE